MAGSSLLTLIDDIASVLDDVAILTKVAARKTAGVLGDDLALNAQQVSGVKADRELPVVWAVAKGSFLNKLILVPTALLISALIPWAITPLLMLGGAFLCYEGFEKLAHRFFHPPAQDLQQHDALIQTLNNPELDIVAFEKGKIKGAVRTDFILSAEIIVITLGTVAAVPLTEQIMVLAGIAIIMTVGVYGLVAGIVKLDDGGLYLSSKSGGGWQAIQRSLGKKILLVAPYMMKSLSVIGTAAMFMVGGSILAHGIPVLHHLAEASTHYVNTVTGSIAGVGLVLSFILPVLFDALIGIVAGGIVLLLITILSRLWKKITASA